MSSPRRGRRKWRCCPECGAVRPASEFAPVARHIRVDVPKARCPACKREGLRLAFAEVEPPEEAEEGG